MTDCEACGGTEVAPYLSAPRQKAVDRIRHLTEIVDAPEGSPLREGLDASDMAVLRSEIAERQKTISDIDATRRVLGNQGVWAETPAALMCDGTGHSSRRE